jgi:hypothetical protein
MLGKQLAYIISGRLHELAFLRPIFEGFAEIQAANTTGIVSDECENLVSALYGLAEDAVFFSNEQYVKPQSFLGVGSHKVLRDNVYGYYRKILCADYFYFRKHKMFDFPRRNFLSWLKVSSILILNKSMLFRKIYYKNAHKKAIKELNEAIEK